MNPKQDGVVVRSAPTIVILFLIGLTCGCAPEASLLSGKSPLAETLSSRTIRSSPRDQDANATLVSHQSNTPGSVTTLTDGELLEDRIRQSDGNVVLDFYADWCSPCQALGQRIEKLKPTVSEHGIHVIKVNIDHHPELARQFNVSGVPTLMRIRDGEVVERQSGAMSEDRLKLWLIK